MLKICLIIPAYNEAPTIQKVVRQLTATFKTTPHAVTIVVVDDGSKDDTAAQAEAAGALVIRHVLNTGGGGATATGVAYAHRQSFDLAATLDADGQHHPKDVLAGINHMLRGEHDLLIGSRLIDNRGMSRVKRIGNKGLSFITLLLFGVNVTDSQSGLRVFSRDALQRLRWKATGYEFCSEMLWRAKQQRLRIGEYPIRAIYTDYSKQKGQNNWNGFNIVKTLVRHRVGGFFSE